MLAALLPRLVDITHMAPSGVTGARPEQSCSSFPPRAQQQVEEASMCLQVPTSLPPQQQLPPLACQPWLSMAATATSSHHLSWLRGRAPWPRTRC